MSRSHSRKRPTSRAVTVGAAALAVGLVGTGVSAMFATADEVAPQPRDGKTITSKLQNSNKSTFLGVNRADFNSWSEEQATGGMVTFPKPGETAVVSIDGTCVPTSQSASSSRIESVPLGDGSSCVKFTSAVVSPGVFTFRVAQPGTDIDGRYLGNGDGVVLDLLSTTPITLLKAAETPAATVEATATIDDADHNGRVNAGDTVAYSATVSNTGDVDLTGVSVTDSLSTGLSGASDTLAAGAQVTVTSSKPHVLTQADIDKGSLANAVTFAGTTPADVPFTTEPTTVSTTFDASSGATLALSSDAKTDIAAGDTVTYTSTVTNSGNVTLHDVSLTQTPGDAGKLDKTTLAPGEKATATSAHVVTQGDIDAGSFSVSVSGGGTAPSGDAVSFGPQKVTTTIGAKADASVTTTSDLGEKPAAGDTVTYTTTIANSGNVTLSGVEVKQSASDDVKLDTTTIAPGKTATATGTHVITQVDVDAGKIVNTISGAAKTPSGDAVTLEARDMVDVIASTSMGHLEVTSDAAASAKVGDTVTYSTVVTNDGSATLTDLELSETLGTGGSLSSTRLAPGETATATSTHVLTQADVDAGSIENTVTGLATAPSGEKVAVPAVTVADGFATTAAATTALTSDAPEVSQAGQKVTYTLTVSNTGDVTLSDLTASGTLTGAAACDVDRILPGESVTCTGTHEVTADEAAAGSFENVVTATASTPAGATIDLPEARLTADAEAPAAPVLAFTGSDGLIGAALSASLLTVLGAAIYLVSARTRRRRA